MSELKKRSAAVALVRGEGELREVLLVHPGGPFWARKEAGAWSLPKGELEEGEDELAAAQREFSEETGQPAPPAPYLRLGEVKQKGGKWIIAFAAQGSFDAGALRSNLVELEWPRGSGKRISFPEVDRAVWATAERARALVNPAQLPLVERALAADFSTGG
jgi:predicted NUDIX family NTP pyrophosphohydrolase